MEVLFTLILSIVFWTGTKSACPRNYTFVSISGLEKCLFVPREYKYWLDARQECIEVHRGRLLEVASIRDFALVTLFFSGLTEEKRTDLYDSNMWTGGITQEDGSWVWNFTGATVNPAFTQSLPKVEKQALTIHVNSLQFRALPLHTTCENPIRWNQLEPCMRNFICETELRIEQGEEECVEKVRGLEIALKGAKKGKEALERKVEALEQSLDEAEKEKKEERERQKGRIVALKANQFPLLEDTKTAREVSGFRLGEFEIHLQMLHHQLYLVIHYTGSRPVRVSCEVRVVATKAWPTPSKSTYNEEYLDGTRQKALGYVLGSGDVRKVLNAYENTRDSFHFEVRILQVDPSAVLPGSNETEGVLQARFAGIPQMVLLDEMYSEPVFLRNTKCRISIQREPEHLGIWVECMKDLSETQWFFEVAYSLTLNRAKDNGISRNGTWFATRHDVFGGWVDFIYWKELIDPGNGWLSGGAINVTANVKINDV